MKEFTVSLIFCHDLSKVLLIKKTHPAKQAGKLNGIGGSFEDGEDTNHKVAAMREVTEECALKANDFSGFYEIGGIMRPKAFISFWTGVAVEGTSPQSKTKEKVDWYDVKKLDDEPLLGDLDATIKFAVTELTKLKYKKIPEPGQINLEYLYDLL